MLTSDQIRAGRALLRWEQATLAERSGVSVETVKRLERMPSLAGTRSGTLDTLQRAFEAAGVVFDLAAGEGPGVRFKGAGGVANVASNALDHPKPVGPATDAVERMEAEIERDRGRRKPPSSSS